MDNWIQKQLKKFRLSWHESDEIIEDWQKQLEQSKVAQATKKYMGKINSKQVSDKEFEKRKKFYPIWMLYGEILLEPVIIAFMLLLVFTRLQQLIETSASFPVFWQRLNSDMISDNWWIYFALYLMIILWAIFKLLKIKREYRIRKDDIKDN